MSPWSAVLMAARPRSVRPPPLRSGPRLNKPLTPLFLSIPDLVGPNAFITPAFRIQPTWVNPERGRDECCPYRRTLATPSHNTTPNTTLVFLCSYPRADRTVLQTLL